MTETLTPGTRVARIFPTAQLLSCLVIFFSGIILGGAGTAWYLKDRWRRGGDSFYQRGPAARRNLVADYLRDSLRLTPSQQEKLAEVLKNHEVAIARIRTEVIPLYEAEINRHFAEIKTLLTPEQAAQWDEDQNFFRQRFFPRRPHDAPPRPQDAPPPPPPPGPPPPSGR